MDLYRTWTLDTYWTSFYYLVLLTPYFRNLFYTIQWDGYTAYLRLYIRTLGSHSHVPNF